MTREELIYMGAIQIYSAFVNNPYDFDVDCSNDSLYDGKSYVTRKWLRPCGKVIYVKINKRKIRNAIKERESELENK